MKQVKHFEVRDEGSVVLITPLSKLARELTEENVQLEAWQWFGGGFAVEHRFADDLLCGIADAGLM
ncbi:MAG: hypothetical protein PHC68_02685 [Syntrophorhabdaceae bacterium]|nr:hypothetical protein [Syntrophorhabdaceae bacterium]